MNTYDEAAMTEAIKLLSSQPYTIAELAKRFKKSERTIKRWLTELRSRGYRVVREGVSVESPYAIVVSRETHDGPSDQGNLRWGHR